MKLKMIVDETAGDYKEPAMFLVTASCVLDCEGCQNVHLKQMSTKSYSDEDIWKRYFDNLCTSAIVIGGLEPFDEFEDLFNFIHTGIGVRPHVRRPTMVIYTGYELDEIDISKFNRLEELSTLYDGQIFIKFGRYRADLPSRHSDILGVTLASENQYVIELGA